MHRFKRFLGILLIAFMSFAVVIPGNNAHADMVDLDWDELIDWFDDDDDYDYDDDYDDEDIKSEPSEASNQDGSGQTKNTTGEIFSSSYKNSTTGYEAWVYDGAGLFAQTEAKILLDEAYKLTEYAETYVITIPKGENPYGSNESATKAYGDNLYIKNCNKDSSIMFIIDMHTRYIYIYRYGKAEDSLTSGKCDTITDNVYSYASSKDYYNCAMKGLEQIGQVMAGQHIAQPMKVVSNLFLALVVGFVIMYLVALGKSKTSKTSDDELLKFAAINFNANNPTDIVTGTTKTYCPRSSGSSGGGRSGGGGGFHGGGGGGHRF